MKKSFMFLFAAIVLVSGLCKADNPMSLWDELMSTQVDSIIFSLNKDKVDQFEKFFDNKLATTKIHTAQEAEDYFEAWFSDFFKIESDQTIQATHRKRHKLINKFLDDTIMEKWDKRCAITTEACDNFDQHLGGLIIFVLMPFIKKKINTAYPLLKKENEMKNATQGQVALEAGYPFLKD